MKIDTKFHLEDQFVCEDQIRMIRITMNTDGQSWIGFAYNEASEKGRKEIEAEQKMPAHMRGFRTIPDHMTKADFAVLTKRMGAMFDALDMMKAKVSQ